MAQWSTNLTYKCDDGVIGLWQFGGETNYIRTNKVAGQVCDQDYLLIDYPSKIKKMGKNGFKKEETITLEQVAKKVINGEFKNQPLRSVLLLAYIKKNKLPYTVKQVQSKVNELLKKK